MASVIQGTNGRDIYHRIVRNVLENGEMIAPRGQETLDVGPAMIILDSPYDALPLGVGRRLDPKIAAVEAVQLIGAFCDDAPGGLISRQAPRLLDYADGGQLHGAYGRRIGYQTRNSVQKLRDDPSTRQAVITLWDPWMDNLHGKKDYPCTVMLQPRIRRDRLDLNVVMRSSDAWLGLPYDMFQFTQLQLSIANALDIEPGQYVHFTSSLHLYVRNVDAAKTMLEQIPLGTGAVDFQPRGIGRRGMRYVDIEGRARRLSGATNRIDDLTESEGWFREYLIAKLPSHMG